MKKIWILLGTLALASCGEKAPSPDSGGGALLHPDPAALAAAGPDSFVVHFTTSRGPFDVTVHRAWSPHGADRFYYLASHGFFDGDHFFRVLDGFMAQFGINGNPAVSTAWRELNIPDDPVVHGNRRGVLTFADAGPNTRRTQLFINYRDNPNLDAMGFSGIGDVTAGMPAVDSLFKGYGEGEPSGFGPSQGQIEQTGNSYLARQFPLLDSIVTATVVHRWPAH